MLILTTLRPWASWHRPYMAIMHFVSLNPRCRIPAHVPAKALWLFAPASSSRNISHSLAIVARGQKALMTIGHISSWRWPSVCSAYRKHINRGSASRDPHFHCTLYPRNKSQKKGQKITAPAWLLSRRQLSNINASSRFSVSDWHKLFKRAEMGVSEEPQPSSSGNFSLSMGHILCHHIHDVIRWADDRSATCT